MPTVSNRTIKILPTNYVFRKLKPIDSPSCSFCGNYPEALTDHLHVECHEVNHTIKGRRRFILNTIQDPHSI